MSSNGALELRPAMPAQRAGQATMVEQSRAVAEVQAQVIVAQQMPRSIDRAIREMQRSCSMKSLADRAFYRFSRGGQQVSGPTIQLARELARAWGNVDFGIAELRRDDEHGQSEMLAFAWDLETNARTRTTFIVQHVRDTRSGSRALTDQRDIYELNANNGARRLREMIFAILPGWYVEDAIDACNATLANDKSDGATVAERAANAAARFGKIGVTAAQLEQKLGAPQGRWSAADLATLAVIFKSIERSETTAEDEFGAASAPLSPSDLAPPKSPSPAAPESPVSGPAAAPPSAEVAAAGEAPSPGPAPGDPAWQRALKAAQAQFKRFTGDDQAARLGYARRLLRVSEVLSFNDLTLEELRQIGEVLSGLRDRAALDALLDDGEADPRGQDGQAGDE